MPDLDTKILPILPFQTGVVLPHMTVTLTLETPEARAAVAAARSAGDTLVLVPRTDDGRYARVGTVAMIEDSGRTPRGVRALVIRGLPRGLIGSGAAGTGDAIWVQVDDRPDPDEVDDVPDEIRDEMRFHPVVSVEEALAVALEPADEAAEPAAA